MNIAIVGSRSVTDPRVVAEWFGLNWREDMHVICGGAPGVDSIAATLAAQNGDDPEVIRPDYRKYPVEKYGKDYAPKMRNQEIVKRCEKLVAFWDGRSTGTSHAIAWAVYLKRPVWIVMQELPQRTAGGEREDG